MRSDFPNPATTLQAMNRLFLAHFPDPGTAAHILELAARIRQQHGLTGRLRPPGHLHITLHWLGDYAEVPETVVESAGQACAAVAARMPSFEVTLDAVSSFRGRPGNHPLILARSGEGNAPLIKFHQALGTELAKRQCYNKNGPPFSPHLTLLYDKQVLQKQPVEPVSWAVSEIVLVRSEVGATKYHRLGRWTLGG